MPGSNAPPDQISIPTCIGCGAMSRPGTYEAGRAEHKLVLVRGAALDALTNADTMILANTAALTSPAGQLVDRRPTAGEWQTALTSVQQDARVALARAPDNATIATELAEAAEPAITWWCDRCGGIDAPQPCLGICIWRTINLARHDAYQTVRDRVLAERETEYRLRALLRRVVCTRAHSGQYAPAWRTFAAQAATTLDRRTRRDREPAER